ncbi:hypothetical protein CASFOL_022925 [Castilleja foliolosa]|uniref:UBC core domain-containing protein n=1 Tax=Castilleja foliolosa TaxID=1961234 RepID=A0ABD3CTS0_9LAMI
MTLKFTEDYPNKPPTVRFVSRMFHPDRIHQRVSYFCFARTCSNRPRSVYRD